MRELRFAVEHNPDYPSASRRTRETAAEGVMLPRKRQGRSQPFGIVIGCVSPVLQGHRLANESANDPVSGSFLARGVDPTSAFMGRAMGRRRQMFIGVALRRKPPSVAILRPEVSSDTRQKPDPAWLPDLASRLPPWP